jgi:hypothetical protein
MPDAELWAKQIKDQIADSSKVREGLNDDEAISLIDWGNQQAHTLAETMANTPEPTTKAVDTKGYDLVRLMTRITWLATYRHKKDAPWLTQTFKTINQINQTLHGPNAPAFSDEEINTWLATHNQYSNSELIQNLMARLTSPAPDPAASPATLTSDLLPAQSAPPATDPTGAPATLTSDLLPAQPATDPGVQPTPPTVDPAAPNTTDLVQNLLQRMKAKKAAPPPQGEDNGS